MTVNAKITPHHLEVVRVKLKHDTADLYGRGVGIYHAQPGDILWDYWINPITNFDGGSVGDGGVTGVTLSLRPLPLHHPEDVDPDADATDFFFCEHLRVIESEVGFAIDEGRLAGYFENNKIYGGGARGFIPVETRIVARVSDNALWPAAPDPLPTVGEIELGLVVLAVGPPDG